MEHITQAVTEPLHQSAQWEFYFPGRSVGVLDIETTGLDRKRCSFVLGGLYDPEAGEIHQVFAEDPAEEGEALKEYLGIVSRYDVLVTYNGRHFDLPFLEARIRRTGLDRTPEGPVPACDGYDLDIYQVVNGHSPLRRLLPNLKQKTVEAYMGLWSDRSDEISGAESVELYEHYVRTGDPSARRKILLHNSDDVLQLTRLLKVLDKADLHRAMYHMGFPVGSPARRWQVRKLRLSGDAVIAEGSQGPQPVEYRSYQTDSRPLQALFDAKAAAFRMEIPILRQSGIAAADLTAAGLGEKEFQKYPSFGSGFLVVEDANGVKYREVVHLVKAAAAGLERMIGR